MESTPVNWEALDIVVIEFAKLENLIKDSSSAPSPSPSSSPSSSSYHSRLIIRLCRRFLETVAIDAAVDLLRLHAPSILFRLHKQKFVELLRKGTSEDRDSAIDCLRIALAPDVTVLFLCHIRHSVKAHSACGVKGCGEFGFTLL